VAREASSLVLTDDAFSSIVAAVRVGRRIYDNLKKAMAYILAVHVPIAGMSLLPVLVPRLFGVQMPLVLFPVHIAFLELIIDPACSVVFEAEAEESDIMARAPRPADEPMFSKRMIGISVVQGIVVLAAVMGVYLWAVFTGHTPNDVRGLSFAALVAGNLGLIFVNRSWTHTIFGAIKSKNVALWAVTAGTLVVLALLLTVPSARDLFQFATMHPSDLAISLGAGVLSVMWFEVYKIIQHARKAPVA
jgi:Ca2+-transporting ATPase